MPHPEPTAEHIALDFLRDFEQARETRGLRFTTASSINDSSRLIMAAIHRHGRY